MGYILNIMTEFSSHDYKIVLKAQKLEISEYYIYKHLAKMCKTNNRQALAKLSEDSLKHYRYWQRITNKKVLPNKFRIWWYVWVSKFFGLTFGIKLLEQSEEQAEKLYTKIKILDQDFNWIIKQEKGHEKGAEKLIDEDLLKYVSSIILGSNDALVELTGALAGLTLALQNNQLIAATGLITGLAASLSMASSEYLSTKSEVGVKKPVRAAIYTGMAYVLTVIFLILPYFVFSHYLISLGATLLSAAIIILLMSFYVSVTQGISFKRRFTENIILSFGVALLSFIIGYLVREIFGIDV